MAGWILCSVLCLGYVLAMPTVTKWERGKFSGNFNSRTNSWIINPPKRPSHTNGLYLPPGGMLLMMMEPNMTSQMMGGENQSLSESNNINQGTSSVPASISGGSTSNVLGEPPVSDTNPLSSTISMPDTTVTSNISSSSVASTTINEESSSDKPQINTSESSQVLEVPVSTGEVGHSPSSEEPTSSSDSEVSQSPLPDDNPAPVEPSSPTVLEVSQSPLPDENFAPEEPSSPATLEVNQNPKPPEDTVPEEPSSPTAMEVSQSPQNPEDSAPEEPSSPTALEVSQSPQPPEDASGEPVTDSTTQKVDSVPDSGVAQETTDVPVPLENPSNEEDGPEEEQNSATDALVSQTIGSPSSSEDTGSSGNQQSEISSVNNLASGDIVQSIPIVNPSTVPNNPLNENNIANAEQEPMNEVIENNPVSTPPLSVEDSITEENQDPLVVTETADQDPNQEIAISSPTIPPGGFIDITEQEQVTEGSPNVVSDELINQETTEQIELNTNAPSAQQNEPFDVVFLPGSSPNADVSASEQNHSENQQITGNENSGVNEGLSGNGDFLSDESANSANTESSDLTQADSNNPGETSNSDNNNIVGGEDDNPLQFSTEADDNSAVSEVNGENLVVQDAGNKEPIHDIGITENDGDNTNTEPNPSTIPNESNLNDNNTTVNTIEEDSTSHDLLALSRRNLLSLDSKKTMASENEEKAQLGQEVDSGNELNEENSNESSRQYGHRPYPFIPEMHQIPHYHPNYPPLKPGTLRTVYDYCYGIWCSVKTSLHRIGLL